MGETMTRVENIKRMLSELAIAQAFLAVSSAAIVTLPPDDCTMIPHDAARSPTILKIFHSN